MIKTVRLDLLRSASFRYSGPHKQRDAKLRYVIQQRGQLVPVHVRQVGDEVDGDLFEIIDGHRIVDALRELGQTEVVVFIHGVIGRREALTIAVELNENKGLLHSEKLAKVFKELAGEDRDYGSVAARVCFTAEEIESYSMLDKDFWETLKKKGPEGAVGNLFGDKKEEG